MPFTDPVRNDRFKPVERSTADEEDVCRIDLDIVLLPMLSAALRRDVGNCPFNNFQERLVHPFTRYVACNGRAVVFFEILSISSM